MEFLKQKLNAMTFEKRLKKEKEREVKYQRIAPNKDYNKTIR